MHNLDLVKVNHALIVSIKLVGACRRMVGPKSDINNELIDINRELREAAAECQRVLVFMEEKRSRFLLVQDRYK